MVNCNPETVSTDYDTSDRLYFEPLDDEEVLAVLEREQPVGVVHPVRRPDAAASSRARSRRRATGSSGTPFDAIDLAEDRERFGALARRARHPLPGLGDRSRPPTRRSRPPTGSATRCSSGPSYVLGGRAMRVCYDDRRACARRWAPSRARCSSTASSRTRSRSTSTRSATARTTYIAAVMQHVEEAGVHSGDSSCVLPAPSLTPANAREVEHDRPAARRRRSASSACSTSSSRSPTARSTCSRRTRARRARCRSRRRRPASTSSRPPAGSPPGAKLARPRPAGRARRRSRCSVKAAVLPFARFPGADPVLGPEMRSTGEVMASAVRPADGVREGRARGRPAAARRAARRSSRSATPTRPRVRPGRRGARRARLRARRDRRHRARRSGRRARGRARCAKVADATSDEQTVVDLVRRGRCDLVVNTPQGSGRPRRRLPDPRGRAGRPRAVHHDDLRRRGRRARDRERARRDRALAPGAHRMLERRRVRGEGCASPAPRRSGRTRSCASSAARSSPACPGSSSCSRRRARAAAADVALPRPRGRARRS